MGAPREKRTVDRSGHYSQNPDCWCKRIGLAFGRSVTGLEHWWERHARNNFPTAASIAEPCVDDAYRSRLLPAIFIQSDQSITIGGGCNVVRHLCREPFQIAGLERLASAVMGGYSVGDLLFAHGFGANRRPAKELRVPKACDNVPDRCPHKLPVSLFSVDEAGSGEAGVVCGSDWTLL